jgi:hypothetical protein
MNVPNSYKETLTAMGNDDRTNQEYDLANLGIVAGVKSLMSDYQRLRTQGFASKFALLASLGIDAPSFYRDLRADYISPRNLDLLVGALATVTEASALGSSWAYAQSSRLRRPEAMSLASLLRHPIDDARYWDREFRSLRMAYGFFGEQPTIEDLYLIYERSVAVPRSLADYGTTMRNGLILTQWFLNRSKDTLEDMMVAGTFLMGLSHAASQAEYLPVHKRSLRIGKLLLNRNANCPFLNRLVRDIEGQFLYNSGPENRTILMKAFRVHDEEIAVADKIGKGISHPIGDCQLAVGESYYNRLSILVKLGISGRAFDREYARLEHRVHELSNSLPRDSGTTLTSNIGRDVGDFGKILRIRQCLLEKQLTKAVEHAERLATEAQTTRRELTFFGGYAHYWAGVAKKHAATNRLNPGQIEDIGHHAAAALQAFSKIGNTRMKSNTQRDLMMASIR